MPRTALYRRRRQLRPRSTVYVSPRCPLKGTNLTPSSALMPIEAFARLVVRALDSLPSPIAAKLSHVAVSIEDAPSSEALAERGLSRADEIFGLYRGIPYRWRTAFVSLADFPDKLEIYYHSATTSGLTPRDIQELVRRVIVHEVERHFGTATVSPVAGS